MKLNAEPLTTTLARVSFDFGSEHFLAASTKTFKNISNDC